MGTSLTTPKLQLRFPAGLVGEAPDPPDDFRKLALDVEATIAGGALAGRVTLFDGVSYDGYNDLFAVGQSRTLHLALYTSAGLTKGQTWVQVGGFDRAVGAVFDGGAVAVSGVWHEAAISMDASGNVSWFAGDAVSGAANGLRGTLHYRTA